MGVAVSATLAACAYDDVARPLAIRSSRIAFVRERSGPTVQGKLLYRGGLQLSSSDRDFGGISAMLVSADGSRFVAVTDEAHWITGSLQYNDGNLSGIRGDTIAPLLDMAGVPLDGKAGDAEGLASVDGNDVTGDLLVAFEGEHRVWRYPFAKDGVHALPAVVPFPAELQGAPNNGGLEGVTMFRDGLVFAITERYRDAAGEYRAWFVPTTPATTASPSGGVTADAHAASEVSGSRAVSLRALPPFAMTDVRRLPDGDLLTLERRYSAAKGVGSQLRRIPAATAEAAASTGVPEPLDGELVASFDAAYEIDNMEGLAVRTGVRGETLVYAVSDDNFNRPVQRTLLLMYELRP